MARTNTAARARTHNGARAADISADQQLRRSLMSCMLWEKEHYESGQQIADRIASLIPQVQGEQLAAMAVEARTKMKIRHAPLFVAREMVRHPHSRPYVAETLAQVVERADELTEFMALYWKDGVTPLAHQVKKGLALAFRKFDEYQLAKYDRASAIVKLRDVMALVRPKPLTEDQAALWRRLASRELTTPDTWEVALSAGGNKREVFTRLLTERKLGALALLRNLRNMQQSGVDNALIEQGLGSMKVERVLPYRFITAARYAPSLEPALEQAMLRCIQGMPQLPGKTVLLIDVSGSMDSVISGQSEMKRLDAACGLAVLGRERCDAQVYTFSNRTVEVPPRRGFALRDAIVQSQPHGGTDLRQAVDYINRKCRYDRLVIFTDEQSATIPPAPLAGTRGYVINVASAQNGVGYGSWTHIDGFSEQTLEYIREFEAAGAE